MSSSRTLVAGLMLTASLVGCGPDAAVTAATAAKLQASQAQQAQAQEAQVKKQLDAAIRATEAAASAAGNQ